MQATVVNLSAQQMLKATGLISPDRRLLSPRSEKHPPRDVLDYFRRGCSKAYCFCHGRPNEFAGSDKRGHRRCVIFDDVTKAIVCANPPRTGYSTSNGSEPGRDALWKELLLRHWRISGVFPQR